MNASPDQGAAVLGWDEESTRNWLAHRDVRETPLLPVLDALMEAAHLQPGERVLDVGCGAGPTTVVAARAVGAAGHVLGVDVAPAMVEAARARFDDASISWLVADAEQHPFEAGSFDVVLSRFGVMFFADPARAFANLASACRVGGRLVVAVWPLRDRSAFFARPLDVIVGAGKRLGVTLALPPVDGGPFALGDPDRLRQLLTAAGWSDVAIVEDQRPLYLGGPGASDEQAAAFVVNFGFERLILTGQPAEVLAAVRHDLGAALHQWRDDVGVGLPGGFLLVSARR